MKLLRRSAGVNETKSLRCEKDIVNRVGLHPMAISILGRMIKARKDESGQEVDDISEKVLKELKEDGVLMMDEAEKVGEEWVKNWLKSLKLENHFELLVEVGGFDTKESMLELTKDDLKDLNEETTKNKKIKLKDRKTLLKCILAEREEDTERRHKCVYACIQMSVKQLNDEMKEWFLRMAVFPEDAIVPMGCLQELWETKRQHSVKQCISKLVSMNLVETTGRTNHYRLHDLCRASVRLTLREKGKMGETQMNYVRRFADKKIESLSASSFRKYLFEDGDQEVRKFVRDNMMWHLKDAGLTFKYKKARELFVTLSFSIEWMEMRLGENGDVAAVFDDLETARKGWDELEKKNIEDEKDEFKIKDDMATQMRVWLRRLEQVIRISPDVRDNPKVLAEEVWQSMHSLIEDPIKTSRMTSLVTPWSVMVREEAQRRRRIVGRMWSEVPWMKSVGGAMLGVLKGHSKQVSSVAILNDSKNQLCKSGLCVVSGSDDKTVRIWDATGREGKDGCLRVFKGHSNRVRSVAILNDPKKQLCNSGLCVVSGSEDKTVRIWDAVKSTCLYVNTFESRIRSVYVLPVPNSVQTHYFDTKTSSAMDHNRQSLHCIALGLKSGAIRVMYV